MCALLSALADDRLTVFDSLLESIRAHVVHLIGAFGPLQRFGLQLKSTRSAVGDRVSALFARWLDQLLTNRTSVNRWHDLDSISWLAALK